MKKLIWLFPVLFLIDDILGINGYQFTIFGVGIRIILFALSVAVLCGYCLGILIKYRFTLWKRKPDRPHFWDYAKPMDGFVLGFLALNFLWATAIPLLVRGNMTYAVKDFTTLLVLVLYFPCAFLMRTRRLTLRSLNKWLIPLLMALALWHTVMYIGEVVAPGFYAGYYDFIDMISFGTAVRTDVIFGFGITRIIQVTSIFLIPAMFLLLEQFCKGRWKLGIPALALTLFAVMITYTKSIWYGILAGVVLAIAGILIFRREKGGRRQVLTFALALAVLFCVFNFGFLNNTVITRAMNSARPGTSASLDEQIASLQSQLNGMEGEENWEDLQDQLEDLIHLREDAVGTAEANALRAKQNEVLLKKWSESKYLGFGYGAYAEDCIRNEDFPFMYESLIPALMMKLGIVGMLAWGVFVLALVIFAVKAMWKKPVKFWCWISTALAFAMAVQTNPFLFTFAGFSMMLYLLLFITGTKEEI
ncbi:MAG: hypothetical protein IKK11_05785 [Oscillospiraceae bacterium]|nr:hypothetical protein [Oscillospiraceae bacterium]